MAPPKTPFVPAKPRTWIPVLAFLVALLGIGTTGFLQFKRHSLEMENTAREGIAAVADLKAGQIVQWVSQQQRVAEAIRRDDLLADEVERWFQQGAPEGKMAQKIRARLASLRQLYQYDSIALLDGKARLRLIVGNQMLESEDKELVMRSMRDNAVTRSDIHWSDDQKPELDWVAPLAVSGTPGPHVIGAVILNIDPNEFLFPYLQTWPTKSPSGETLLVRRDGNEMLHLNELRFRKGAALRLRTPTDLIHPAAMGLAGQIGEVEGMDYRGVPVMAATRTLADTPWILVAKQDRSEIDAPLRRLMVNTAEQAALFLVLIGAIAALWWRKLHAQQRAALLEERFQRQALEKQFDFATKYARDIVLLFNETGQLVECNEASSAAYGYTRDELLQVTLSELQAVQTRAAIAGDMKRAASPGGITLETVHRRKDGSTFPVEMSMRLMEIEGRQFLQAIIRDVTERKQAEQELQNSEEHYRTLYNAITDAVFVHQIREDGLPVRFLEVNSVACERLGYTRGELLQMSPLDIDAPDTGVDVKWIGRRILAGESVTFEQVHLAKDGRRIPVEIRVRKCNVRGQVAVLSLVRDITDRKQAEQKLVESEAQFRGLVEQSITGIYIIQDGQFAYVNPRFAVIRGFSSADEMIGRDPLPLIAEKDRATVAENSRRLLAGEIPSIEFTFVALRKDGSSVDVGAHSALATYRGRPAIIGLLQDISEKKRAEEEIRRYVEQLKTAFMSTVEVATTLSEMRDPYTAGHERRVAKIAVAIGAELGFDAHRQEGLQVAGHLHDIGKITIPAEILVRPGKLSAIEFQLIQGHPQAGYEVLKGVEFPWPVAEVALQHHERMDGSGYPQGLKGEAILPEARIVAVADVIEAMSTHRPYRPGLGIEAALAEIERGRGTAYDAEVVDACLKLFRDRGFRLPG